MTDRGRALLAGVLAAALATVLLSAPSARAGGGLDAPEATPEVLEPGDTLVVRGEGCRGVLSIGSGYLVTVTHRERVIPLIGADYGLLDTSGEWTYRLRFGGPRQGFPYGTYSIDAACLDLPLPGRPYPRVTVELRPAPGPTTTAAPQPTTTGSVDEHPEAPPPSTTSTTRVTTSTSAARADPTTTTTTTTTTAAPSTSTVTRPDEELASASERDGPALGAVVAVFVVGTTAMATLALLTARMLRRSSAELDR